MPNSSEMRRLTSKWKSGTGWPKRLDWIEIRGLRGWTGQRFKLDYPIVAVVGENGVGKSTVLQCAAAVYRPSPGCFASDFFPDTTWEQVRDAKITYAVRQGTSTQEGSVRKPGERWRGNRERPERHVKYVDLSRIQPVPARVGYARLAKAQHTETSAIPFEESRLVRFSQIMGRQYELAKMALTDADPNRSVPVLRQHGAQYSGFHQGAGETTVAELLQTDLQQYSIVLIDEIETSLHPRSQRRLIRDLADKCRELELQVVLTTHSPYILDELPMEGRAYILETGTTRNIVYGVSPEFAMTKMDDVPQPECDLYVEDNRTERLLIEIIVKHAPSLVPRCRAIRYGASSVGQSLGIMVSQRRFPRPSCVFLDGDQGSATGCINLPGDDPPERVVLEALRPQGWLRTAERLGRAASDLDDAFNRAMALSDHHEWLKHAAIHLTVGSDTLWQVLCSEWAATCLSQDAASRVVRPIEDALEGIPPSGSPTSLFDASGRGLLFEL
jgi:predicted ATPase